MSGTSFIRRHSARQCAKTAILAGSLGLLFAGSGWAFTQSGVGIDFIGNVVPMGHEWVTRMSAFEVIGGDPVIKPDPNDPRKHWTYGKAKNLDLGEAGKREVARIKSSKISDERYASTYPYIFAAIVGERWVDIGGFNVTKAKIDKIDCWDAVAQEPADIQQDHFMRRYDDSNGQGGVNAAVRGQQRFVEHFVNAAMAAPQQMKMWDGGGYSAQANVDRNYFLFGRAAHLFQDSFSEEHTVRVARGEDFYTQVHQVKSYLCAFGSEQHSHSTTSVVDYVSGDVVWKPGTQFDSGWAGYKASNMKDVALVAVEASKDLWAAFIRTMAVPLEQRKQKAQTEAQTLVENWLSFKQEDMVTWYDNPANRVENYVLGSNQTGKGQSQSDCMKGLGVKSGSQAEKVSELESNQRMCIYNVTAVQGYSDLNDPYLHIPFNWQWKNEAKWLQPPVAWKIPSLPADAGQQVKIKSRVNNQAMTAPDGISNNAWVYNRQGAPLIFKTVSASDGSNYLRVNSNADLFLSYTAVTGAVKLYNSPVQASFEIKQSGNIWTILNTYWKDYMWLNTKTQSPYITKSGNAKQASAQWILE